MCQIASKRTLSVTGPSCWILDEVQWLVHHYVPSMFCKFFKQLTMISGSQKWCQSGSVQLYVCPCPRVPRKRQEEYSFCVCMTHYACGPPTHAVVVYRVENHRPHWQIFLLFGWISSSHCSPKVKFNPVGSSLEYLGVYELGIRSAIIHVVVHERSCPRSCRTNHSCPSTGHRFHVVPMVSDMLTFGMSASCASD